VPKRGGARARAKSHSRRTEAQRRIDTAFLALADNTRKAYRGAWLAWQRWAGEHGRQSFPSDAADVAAYLQARHARGAAPATIHVARAAIAKMHQVSSQPDPTAGSLCRDVLRRIDREGRDRGRGQVAGVGWARSEAAARLAEDDGTLQGLRDGAIIRLMSDTLARISEVAALQCSDVEPDITAGGGTAHIRASKTDQRGDGATRYLGPATLAAIERYLAKAGHTTTGPLFRRVLRGGHGSVAPLAAGSIGEIVRKRLAAVGVTGRLGGHSLRVGSARELAVAGASVAELQQAGGWRSPATPEVYIRRETAARGPVARRRYQVGEDPERVVNAPVALSLPDDFGAGRTADRIMVLSFHAL